MILYLMLAVVAVILSAITGANDLDVISAGCAIAAGLCIVAAAIAGSGNKPKA